MLYDDKICAMHPKYTFLIVSQKDANHIALLYLYPDKTLLKHTYKICTLSSDWEATYILAKLYYQIIIFLANWISSDQGLFVVYDVLLAPLKTP